MVEIKKKKKRINSKKKGNKFELVCAKELTKITNVKWNRVGVSSGARFTTQGIEAFQGDVFTENNQYKNIIIECKATKGRVSLEDLINKKSKFWSWINQSNKESSGKDWLLMFKANNGTLFYVSKKNNTEKITKKLILLCSIKEYSIFY